MPRTGKVTGTWWSSKKEAATDLSQKPAGKNPSRQKSLHIYLRRSRPCSEDHSRDYCVFSCPPPGRVTRGASAPSMAFNFIIGSSCKRKNLNPTSRGFPDLSFFL